MPCYRRRSEQSDPELEAVLQAFSESLSPGVAAWTGTADPFADAARRFALTQMSATRQFAAAGEFVPSPWFSGIWTPIPFDIQQRVEHNVTHLKNGEQFPVTRQLQIARSRVARAIEAGSPPDGLLLDQLLHRREPEVERA